MTMDSEMAALIGTLAGVASSIMTAGFCYGVLKEKVKNLEVIIEKGADKASEYVTFKHFDAIIPRLEVAIREMQVDLKKILIIVKSNEHENSDNRR